MSLVRRAEEAITASLLDLPKQTSKSESLRLTTYSSANHAPSVALIHKPRGSSGANFAQASRTVSTRIRLGSGERLCRSRSWDGIASSLLGSFTVSIRFPRSRRQRQTFVRILTTACCSFLALFVDVSARAESTSLNEIRVPQQFNAPAADQVEAQKNATPPCCVSSACACESCRSCCAEDGCACLRPCPGCNEKSELDAAIAGSHTGLFYNNDFSYITNPAYNAWWPGDAVKQRQFGDFVTFDFGAQYRLRQQSEHNIRGLGLTGVDDDFLLHRTRLFVNMRVGERLRFFAEYIDAASNYEDFAPLPNEENRSDFLDLFVDGELLQLDAGVLSGRVGRQELLYGEQRAVSPLDWANTRRTFDGGMLMWSSDDWEIDAFWMRPVFPNTRQFDNPLSNLQFYGIYSAYKGFESTAAEMYWLAFDNNFTGLRADSLGGRLKRQLTEQWTFEVWGNYQFGQDTNDTSRHAGACTCGLGRSFEYAWKPTLWVYYDWASGGNRLGAGDGYFQFFPLAHKYLGFMDLFGRNNIESPNVLLALQPTERLKLLAWYYYLFLQNQNDTPYSVVNTPFAPGIRPGSTDLGHEIDFLVTYSINARSTLLFGYSHFFAGRYYETPGLPFDGDGDFYYTQYQINF